jgi:hypothetical protein
MRNGVDRYCQEDQTLGKYVHDFVAEDPRKVGLRLVAYNSFADADGDLSVIAAIRIF